MPTVGSQDLVPACREAAALPAVHSAVAVLQAVPSTAAAPPAVHSAAALQAAHSVEAAAPQAARSVVAAAAEAVASAVAVTEAMADMVEATAVADNKFDHLL